MVLEQRPGRKPRFEHEMVFQQSPGTKLLKLVISHQMTTIQADWLLPPGADLDGRLSGRRFGESLYRSKSVRIDID
jgi:hypothetical protein